MWRKSFDYVFILSYYCLYQKTVHQKLCRVWWWWRQGGCEPGEPLDDGEVVGDQLTPWVRGNLGAPTSMVCTWWDPELNLHAGLWVGALQVWVGMSLLKSHTVQRCNHCTHTVWAWMSGWAHSCSQHLGSSSLFVVSRSPTPPLPDPPQLCVLPGEEVNLVNQGATL